MALLPAAATRLSLAAIMAEFKLKRSLSALDLVVFGVGVVIGAGIFTLTGRAAHEVAGPGIVLSFVGLLVVAAARPEATRGYLDATAGRGYRGADGLVHTALATPNLATWVLVPAMGGCDGVRGRDDHVGLGKDPVEACSVVLARKNLEPISAKRLAIVWQYYVGLALLRQERWRLLLSFSCCFCTVEAPWCVESWCGPGVGAGGPWC